MTGYFTGLGSGFERGSAALLGGAGLLGGGSLGRAGEGVFVNAATGNLVLSRQDEFLVGLGGDIASARTYNSLGLIAHDDNGDLWRDGNDRRLLDLPVTLNTTGSTIKRLSADGSLITYTYGDDGPYYRTTDGAGSYDRLKYEAAAGGVPAYWTWTDGSTGLVETYKDQGGDDWRIVKQRDRDGNEVEFEYASGKLAKVTTEDGRWIDYEYVDGNLISVATRHTVLGSTVTLSRTRYAYTSDRLTQVTVDLSPQDDSITDGKVYQTTFTYNGSNQLTEITQTDGSSLAIAYYVSGPYTGRVQTLTQTVGATDTRVTDIIYVDNTHTDIKTYTDQALTRSVITHLTYDAQGRLTNVTLPPSSSAAAAQSVDYIYDSLGNVTQTLETLNATPTATLKRQTDYVLDARGNVTQTTITLKTYVSGTLTDTIVDEVVERTYNTANNVILITSTRSSASSASVSAYDRFVYDGEEHLKYSVSADGLVTEYRYTTTGELEYVVRYTWPGDSSTPAHVYAIVSTIPSLNDMDTWKGGLSNLATLSITRNFYDARGNLTETRSYGKADSSGNPISDEGESRQSFSYDHAGRVLTRAAAGQLTEAFVYDGMGRLILSTDLSGGTTSIAFNDAALTTTVTTAAVQSGSDWIASGASYVAVSTFNKAGELITRTDSGSYTTSGTYAYKYDKLGRLRQRIDTTGYTTTAGSGPVNTYVIYDALGRKVADVGHSGELTEYKYDAAGRQIATVLYTYTLSGTQLSTLANPESEVELGVGGFSRPSAHGYDIWSWTVYDAAGRVVETIAGDGAVTTYEYDPADRLIKTTSYYNKLSAGDITTLKAASSTSVTSPTADGAKDVVTRTFYDLDGRVIGALNAEGGLSRIFYDSAGRKVQETAYFNPTNASLRATGTFTALGDSFTPDPSKDITNRFVYDGQGLLRYSVDALNRVTELVYWQGTNTQTHAHGQVIKTIAHDTPLAASFDQLEEFSYAAVKTAVGAETGDDRVSRAIYNNRGQLRYSVDTVGAVAAFAYDSLGRVIKTTQYGDFNAASVPAEASAWESDLDSWTASHSTNVRITRTYYAARGEARFVVDAEGYVSRFDYNGAGRVSDELLFANKITVSDATTIADVNAAATASGSARVLNHRYTALGQLQYTQVQGTPEFTYYGYFANGTVGTVIEGSWDNQRRTYSVFDASGKKISETTHTTQLEGAVSVGATATSLTQYQKLVSANGQYQLLLTPGGELQLFHKGEMIWTNGVHESVAGATYQMVAQTDGNLVVKRIVPTLSDVVIWSSGTAGSHSGATFFALADADTPPSTSVFTFNKGTAPSGTGVIWSAPAYGVTALNPQATTSVTTTYAYDGLGNLVAVGRPDNRNSYFEYDRAGRVTKEIDALSNFIIYQYDAFGRGVKTTDKRLKESYAFFDRLGRVTDAVDAEGYVTHTNYTVFGEVLNVTRYYDRATNTVSVTAPPQVSANAKDATTSFVYNKLGQVKKVTDAEGFYNAQSVYEGYYEEYTLNAYGQRDAVRNKLGGSTTYTYDKRGLLIEEVLPTLSYLSNGNAQSQTKITNKFEYDSRGNRIKLIEAFGLTEQRTTDYAYDNANRLTLITHPNVFAVANATAAVPGSAVARTEQFLYDTRGNLIESRDQAGAKTFHWYDALNRLTHSVSATGTLTRHFYDKNGNVIETRVYATQLSALPADAKGAPPNPPGTAARVQQFTYDNLNRLTKAKTPNTRTAVYESSLAISAPAVVCTEYEYDSAGNVVRVTSGKLEDSQGATLVSGKQTWSYYDKSGRKTVEIDALNYRTDWSYDTNANVVTERRYATAGPAPVAPANLTTAPTPPATSNDDRVTDFTYDKMGRRLTEKRRSVQVFNGMTDHTTTDVTISYLYNGLGQVTRKTEASTDQINYAYDASGRMTSEERSSYTDVNDDSVTPRVEYSYNGLNDLVRTLSKGRDGPDPTDLDAADRVTTYAYGAGGRLASMTDATTAFTRTYRYDLAGRLTREEYVRVLPTGATTTEGVGYDYDLEGRVIKQGALITSGVNWSRADSGLATTMMKYNAFGEMSERGVNDVYAEKYFYDDAGRLLRTNSGDGVWKYFMYDAGGNQTLMITSAGSDLGAAALDTLDEVLALWTGGVATIATTDKPGVVATITKYDARNQAIQVLEPQRQRNASTFDNLTTTRAYNAFGEVIQEINANVAQIDYVYNTMGRLIQTTSPSVEGVGANGQWISGYSGFAPNASSTTAVTFRPVEHRYYDLSGRLVASRDANGNLTRMTLLEGTGYNGAEALVKTLTDAGGKTTTTKYDIHGDARTITDPLAHVVTQTFDALGRLVQANRPSGLIDYYAYDGLSQRIKHWNSQLGVNVVEQTTYDHQGRVAEVIAMGGDKTTYTHTWSSSMATSGMATGADAFGGWSVTTAHANWNTTTSAYVTTHYSSVNSDQFGRDVYKVDLGAHTSTLTYDKAGRLTQRGGGSAISYTYFNTGRINTTAEGSLRTTTLGYNKLGQVTSELLVAGSATHKNMTASYDALGRLVSWADANSTWVPSATANYLYDAAGNIRKVSGVNQYINATGGHSGAANPYEHWYRYDPMNRVVTQKGKLVGAQIVRDSVGIDYLYDDAGNRVRAESGYIGQYVDHYDEPEEWPYHPIPVYGYFTGTKREDYTYDAANRLTQAKSSNTSWNASTQSVNPAPTPTYVAGTFGYDWMGRVTTKGATAFAASTVITYNAKGQLDTETSTKTETSGGNTTVTTNVATYTYGTGSAYALGSALTIRTTSTSVLNGGSPTNNATSLMTNTYVWWDGAVQDHQAYKPNESSGPTHDSQYTYAQVGGAAQLTSVTTDDGRPRTVTFRNDMNGQAIRRDEADNVGAYGDPHEVWYRFAGNQIGFTGNNGNPKADYVNSSSGAFTGGNTSPTYYTDFDMAFTQPTSSGTASTYTVEQGDTLESIAAMLWGDASLWYKIAEANGLQGGETLIAGTTLIIPAGVVRSSYNASTFAPYDPGEVINPITPTAPKPAKNKAGCGGLGMVVMVVIAVVVAVKLGPHAAKMFAQMFGASAKAAAAAAAVLEGTATGALVGSPAAAAGVVAGGASAAAAGSIVSQAVGVAVGIQDKFSWNAVALAAISGGVGAKLGLSGIGGSGAGGAALRGAMGSAISQGVAVATGLQKQFSWAGVAAAGVSGAVIGHFNLPSIAADSSTSNIAANAGASAAAAIAAAAARSLIEGSDFGDNVMAALPDVVGQTIGNAIAGRVAGAGGTTAAEKQKLAAIQKQKVISAAAGEKADYLATQAAGADGRFTRLGDAADGSLQSVQDRRRIETLGPTDPDADPLAQLERELEAIERHSDHLAEESERIRATRPDPAGPITADMLERFNVAMAEAIEANSGPLNGSVLEIPTTNYAGNRSNDLANKAYAIAMAFGITDDELGANVRVRHFINPDRYSPALADAMVRVIDRYQSFIGFDTPGYDSKFDAFRGIPTREVDYAAFNHDYERIASGGVHANRTLQSEADRRLAERAWVSAARNERNGEQVLARWDRRIAMALGAWGEAIRPPRIDPRFGRPALELNREPPLPPAPNYWPNPPGPR